MKSKLFKPLYPSESYEVYVDYQKRKGLKRQFWKDLPRMWQEELRFRQELEDVVNQYQNH